MMSRIAPRVAAHELRLGRRRKLEVHAAHRALAHVERDVGLRDDGLEAVILELVLAERAREEAAVVLAPLEVDGKGPKQRRFREQHRSP